MPPTQEVAAPRVGVSGADHAEPESHGVATQYVVAVVATVMGLLLLGLAARFSIGRGHDSLHAAGALLVAVSYAIHGALPPHCGYMVLAGFHLALALLLLFSRSRRRRTRNPMPQ